LWSRGSSSAPTSRARVDASTSRSPAKYELSERITASATAITTPAVPPLKNRKPIAKPTSPVKAIATTNNRTVLRLFAAICSCT
jgi:hypothetical protein